MTILEPDVEQELVAAWESWDRHPGTGAVRMEVACRTVAAIVGLTSSELRIVLAALRRLGRARHVAVSDTVGFFTERGVA